MLAVRHGRLGQGWREPVGPLSRRYRVLGRLGEGGMGIVYLAEDTHLRRRVVVKLLSEHTAKSSRAGIRLHREAFVLSALNHPNICTLYDFDECGGSPFLVLEYLGGLTLESCIRDECLPVERVVRLSGQLADALDSVHRRGFVHRDVKPANVAMVGPDRVKILDFGVAMKDQLGCGAWTSDSARALALEEHRREDTTDTNAFLPITADGMRVGTRGYMSPEQARGEPIDARSDLFGLGVVIYEMATGCRAFPHAGQTDSMAPRRDSPIPPTRLRPEIPDSLERVIEKALEPERSLRYQSAAEIRADLARIACHLGHHREPRWGSERSARRAPWLKRLAAGLLTGLLALGAVSWGREREAELPSIRGWKRVDAAVELPAEVSLAATSPLLEAIPSLTAVRLARAGGFRGKLPPSRGNLDRLENELEQVARALGASALVRSTIVLEFEGRPGGHLEPGREVGADGAAPQLTPGHPSRE